jgi:hypothetical protein
METKNPSQVTHPPGDGPGGNLALSEAPVSLETFGGKVHIEWDPEAAVTPLGQLPFFIAFLKTSGLYEPWVRECPLQRRSNNAPDKADVLGTLLLSILSGHRRYAHITALRGEGVNPELLGMKKVLSEDAARRAFKGSDPAAARSWQQGHLHLTYGPLLYEPWILDVDTTVKTLYGHQEGAEVGYNPAKPGRPSHSYHTYFVADLRLVLEVEVQAGNRTAAKWSRPGLWSLLERLGRPAWPRFIRGDCAWGSEGPMAECEERGVDYLFKVRQTAGVRRLVEKWFSRRGWVDAGQGWEGVEDRLLLSGWSRSRRVVVLRRRVREEMAAAGSDPRTGQLRMAFLETSGADLYEYAVLVTSLSAPVLTVAQHYRDRADAENNFDEMKNHWGLSGYTTRDLHRCRIMARMVAQVYNWWSLFARLVIPERHAEAVTSRPLLLHGVGKLTRHGGQQKVTITSLHGKRSGAQRILVSAGRLFQALKSTAEQLTRAERWRWLLSIIFRKFLGGRLLQAPLMLEYSG